VLDDRTDDSTVLGQEFHQRTLQPDRDAALEAEEQELPDQRGAERKRDASP
jgi:hypothetical protein